MCDAIYCCLVLYVFKMRQIYLFLIAKNVNCCIYICRPFLHFHINIGQYYISRYLFLAFGRFVIL